MCVVPLLTRFNVVGGVADDGLAAVGGVAVLPSYCWSLDLGVLALAMTVLLAWY